MYSLIVWQIKGLHVIWELGFVHGISGLGFVLRTVDEAREDYYGRKVRGHRDDDGRRKSPVLLPSSPLCGSSYSFVRT
jgi:hypothetical protein